MIPIERARDIAAQIEYKDLWNLIVGEEDGKRPYLYWRFISPDYTKGGEPAMWNSRKWYLSQHMTESEIVQTALAAALMAEEHEAREAFSYKGKHLFNPHIGVASMLAVCEQLEVRA